MNYRILIFFECFVLLWLASPAPSPVCAQAKGTPPAQAQAVPNAPHFAFGGDAAEIPAEFIGNVAFLPVRVDQSRPLFFVLDSTAPTSSIDSGRASALGISATQAPVLGLNGVDLSFSALRAIAKDDFGLQVGRAYEGTLGGDFFQRLVVEIDYTRHTVRLYDPSDYNYVGQGTAFPLTFADGIPIVEAKFSDSKGKMLEGSFVVDTATNASIVIFDRYAEAHRISPSRWKTIASVDPALNGSAGAVVGRLKGFQLGRYATQDTLVTFSRSDLPGASDARLAGAIGTGMLSRFTVVFDYPHHQLIVAPNSSFASDDQEDKSGISVVAKGNALRTFEIVAVTPGTPAAKAGIQKGDVIAGVDEDAAADLTLAEIRELFRQIGHKYTLVIDRGGQTKQITVEMRRLLQ